MPESARTHPDWWSNSKSRSHASAWLAAGWTTRDVGVAAGVVSFVRSREVRDPHLHPYRCFSLIGKCDVQPEIQRNLWQACPRQTAFDPSPPPDSSRQRGMLAI